MPEVQWLVTAFPNFVRYVVVGFALAALFLWIYILITPWREFALIRSGNSAAATALVGALLGFSLPLANTIAHSVSLTDVVLWALVALVVQAIVHVGMRLVLPGLKQAIEANHAAAGITAGGFAVCFGLINAACGSALSRGGSTTTDTSNAAPSQSQRGGFGRTGSQGGLSGTS